MKKILIIRFSSIGDIVLTSSVVRCIKKQLPEAELHYATKAAYKSLLESNPYIDKVHLLDKSLKALIADLKKEKYDLIIDLHNNLRTHYISFCLNNKVNRVNKLNLKKWVFVNFKINTLPPLHIVDRYFNAACASGIKNDFEGLDFFFSKDIDFEKLSLPVSHKKIFIAWVIGGKHETKIFPVDKIINICKHLDVPVILLGDGNDKVRGEVISEAVPFAFNAAGLFNLEESAAIIKNAAVVITNDTGLMHIAAAFHKKIISLWGNTVTDFGMYPYLPQNKENYKIIEVKNLKCRPCSKLGYKECPKKHFRCMRDISEAEIVDAVKSFTENG